MISAPIAKAIDFPIARQAVAQAPRAGSWLARIKLRLQRRQQADAACLIH